MSCRIRLANSAITAITKVSYHHHGSGIYTAKTKQNKNTT